MLPKLIVWCGNKGCKNPKARLAGIICSLGAFQQPKEVEPCNKLHPHCNAAGSREICARIALPGSYYRILLTVTFQMNNDRDRVYLRTSLSGLQPGMLELLIVSATNQYQGSACELGRAGFENCRLVQNPFPALTLVGGARNKKRPIKTYQALLHDSF
jgi:hypothetical protein